MANTKQVEVLYEAGATVYVTFYQVATSYLLDDATGLFAASPADFFLLMTPDADQDALYRLSEARSAWADGRYFFTVYEQLGGSPDPATDTPLIGQEFFMESDAPVTAASINLSVSNSSVVTQNIGGGSSDLNSKYLKTILKDVGRILDLAEKGKTNANRNA